MCKHENCERHEYDYGLCLPHLKESLGLIFYTKAKEESEPVQDEKPTKRRSKKTVDAEELEVREEE